MAEKEEVDKYENFDRHVNGLFKLCSKIQKGVDSSNLNLTNKENPITRYLERFIKLYNAGNPEDFITDFKNIYLKHKHDILNDCNDDNWLIKHKVVLESGEKYKINLSAIYRNSIELRNKARDRLSGIPEHMTKDHKDLLYPDIFRYYLYAIFNELNIGTRNSKIITKNMNKLGEKLGFSSSEVENETNLDGLTNMVKTMAKKFGVDIPENMKIPDGKQITNFMSTMLENPNVQGLFKNVQNMVKTGETPDIKNIVDGFAGAVQNLNAVDKTTESLDKLTIKLPPETLHPTLSDTLPGTLSGTLSDINDDNISFD
jgi:hypothetical protein